MSETQPRLVKRYVVVEWMGDGEFRHTWFSYASQEKAWAMAEAEACECPERAFTVLPMVRYTTTEYPDE